MIIYTINLSDAVRLGDTNGGDVASPVGLQGHIFVAVGGRLAATARAQAIHAVGRSC